MALSEFQDRSMHPLNNILNKVIPDFIQPHLLWTSKQQLHYSQTLLIRGLLPNKYHQNCTNVSEDEFEWSPDESDLPPATLGPARTDRTNISKWRRWLKQASAYAEAPLRVGALDWPISLMPYHVLQLQAIAAVRAAHPDKFRLSQPVGSAFTTVGSYIIKLNPHQHDLAIWNQVLLLSKNLAVLEEQSVSNIVLSVSRLARKQGNIKFAEKLLNTLISNITNLSNTSCFIESCKVLLKTLTNFQYSPPIEEKHIPIYYECSKLLFLKNELVTACDIILNSFSNYLIIIDNLSGITHEYISRMFITLSKWIQTDVSLFELVCNIKSEQSGLYSLLFIGNFMSHDFTWKDCITGLLQHVANEKYSSNLGKAWLKFANWNYKLGTKMHNSIDYDQNLILLSSEEDKILQLLPNYFSHEVKTTFINSFSKMVVQRNSNENQKLFIGDNAFVFNSIPNFIEIQELCSNYPCLKEINCDHKLLTIWYEVIERLFSPYIYSAQAYFTFLTKSFDNIKESDCIQATLRLHRLTENFFTEMRHTLKSGYYSTPIRVWKRIIPQVVNQLNNPKIGVRRIIQFLIYKMAEFWPYLLLYRAILSSPLSQNENIKDKIQCLSYIQNSKSLVTVLQKISKQNHKLVNSTRCLINEFQRISLLWDELWLACLTSVHKEFVNLLYLLDCELIKLSELYYLNLDCKKTLITAKYQLIMSPIFKLILLLMDTITLPPDTPYECTFQNNNSTFIFDSINDIRNPHEPYHQGHIIDKYRKLIDFFLSLQQKQLTEKVMKLSYLSPILSTMMHEEALLPAISTIDDKPIFLTNVCQDILIQPTKTRPKKLGMNASDGKLHYFLFKGLENLHLDERMMQMLGIVNCILNDSNSHPQGFFQTRHYRVTPLGAFSGIIEWVDNATPIFTLYKRWQLNSIPKSEMNTNLNTLSITPLKPSELFYLKLNPLLESLGISTKSNVSSTRKIWPKNVLKDVYLVLKNETPSNLISCELWFNSTCSSEWWIIQQSYCRSLAVMSITGYIIGLGDRHLDNILLDFATGEIIHVDYNVCFENGIKLRVPEMVPFRLTQNFRRALGPSDIEGNFKISCKKTMITYIKEKEILLNLLRTFVNDPLVNWANAKLIEQSLIFDLFTNMKNHANIISNERILSIEIMEHWPRWTHLYNNGIAISGTILKAINEYQTNLVQKNTNDELLIECGRQLSVISEIGNSTFNSYRVTLVEFKNHIDKKKSLVSSLNYKLEVLKSDQYTFGMKNYLTKIEVFHMFKILHNLSISEFLRDYNNLPLELLVSSIPDELKIEYSTLQSQLFNLMICSTNEIKDLLYLLDEHCDFAELNLSDVRSYWIDLLEIVSCEPTVGNMNLVLNEVNQYFIDQSLLIDKVTGGLSQLRLHLQNVELNLKSLEERTHELNFTSSSDLSGELETIFENIFLYVNDNDGANSRTVLNLIGASLPQKFEKWYWMERIAKNSGNNLCELVSEDGDWFLEELCTMSGNVYQMIKCGKLVLSHIKLPKFQTLKKLFKSIKYTNRLYCGLRDLYRNFQKDFMPLIIQIQQSNEFQHLKFHLDEIKGTSDLLSLIAEAEKIYQDVSSNNYNSEKSKIHSIADSMIDRYKQYLECLHFDLKIPTFQLILLIFDNYLKLSQIYEDYQILNWKEHALSLTFAMENFQRSQLLQTFVHPSKRQLFSELFFFKYLLMNYNIIQSAMNMMSILTEQTFNRSVFIISSESDLLLPLRRYLADFIIMRVLGSPTQVLLSVILSIMDCLGILPTFKMEESIINISKRGVENFFQIHPSPSNIGDISRTIASFDMTWRRKNMCKRVNSNIDITKFCLIRARDFLNVYCLNFVLLLEECPFKSKFCGWINKISKSGLGMLNKIQNLLLNKIQLLDSEFFQQISLIPNSSLLSSIFEKYINKRNVIVFELSSLIDRVAKYFSDTISFYKFRWISEEFIAFGIFLLNSLEELKLTVEIVKKFENEFLIPERCLLYLDLTITQDTTRSDVIYKLETEKKKLGCIGCNLEKKIMRGYSYINTSFDSLINLMKDFNELYLSVQEILVTLSHSIKTNEIWCRILKYFEYAIKIWCNISSTNLDTNDLEKIFDIIGAVQNILKWTVGYLLYFSARDLGMDITSMLECDFSNIPNLHNLNIFQERLVNKIRISLLQFPINENISNGNYLQYENKIKSDVWLRINNKFAGMESDSISEIVDGIINDALNVDNLSQMYEGWTSWV